MKHTARLEKINARQVRNRIVLLLGSLALMCCTQLWARDPDPAILTANERQQAPRHVLVISVPDRKLALTADGRVVKVYPVAVGTSVTPSPTGSMKIANKLINPTWYHRGKVVPPGKLNPLGTRWMGLNQGGYGIHGTNVPTSIGTAASHGCFRMSKHDVEELFSLVRVGDLVEIHGERDEQVAEIFGGPQVLTAGSAASVSMAATQAAAPRASASSAAVTAAMVEEAASAE